MKRGENMNFAEGLLVAANGIIVVFIVLISLCLVVKIISLVVGAIPDKEKQTTENNVQPVSTASTVSNVSAPQPEGDIKSQGDIILKGVDDETAVAIMAAVSETARKNGENPKFKSIKKID